MDNEDEKKRNKKQTLMVVLGAMIAVLIIIGGTYAWLRIGLNSNTTNKIKAGALDLRIDESPTSGETVRLERAIPQSYRQGITNPPYRFTIVNNSSMDTDYTLTLEDLYEGADASLTANDKIDDSLIRYILVKNDEEMVATNSKLLSTGRNIETGTISAKSGNTATEIPYTLYIWIDSTAGDDGTQADIMNKVFNARLSIAAEQHHASNPTPTKINLGEGTIFRPTYFAFGYYEINDGLPEFPATTEVPVGHNIYASKDGIGNKAVCLDRNGTVHCFQTNNVAYEQTHVQQVFTGEYECQYETWDQSWTCHEEWGPGCAIYDNGGVYCWDENSHDNCQIDANGLVTCYGS